MGAGASAQPRDGRRRYSWNPTARRASAAASDGGITPTEEKELLLEASHLMEGDILRLCKCLEARGFDLDTKSGFLDLLREALGGDELLALCERVLLSQGSRSEHGASASSSPADLDLRVAATGLWNFLSMDHDRLAGFLFGLYEPSDGVGLRTEDIASLVRDVHGPDKATTATKRRASSTATTGSSSNASNGSNNGSMSVSARRGSRSNSGTFPADEAAGGHAAAAAAAVAAANVAAAAAAAAAAETGVETHEQERGKVSPENSGFRGSASSAGSVDAGDAAGRGTVPSASNYAHTLSQSNAREEEHLTSPRELRKKLDDARMAARAGGTHPRLQWEEFAPLLQGPEGAPLLGPLFAAQKSLRSNLLGDEFWARREEVRTEVLGGAVIPSQQLSEVGRTGFASLRAVPSSDDLSSGGGRTVNRHRRSHSVAVVSGGRRRFSCMPTEEKGSVLASAGMSLAQPQQQSQRDANSPGRPSDGMAACKMSGDGAPGAAEQKDGAPASSSGIHRRGNNHHASPNHRKSSCSQEESRSSRAHSAPTGDREGFEHRVDHDVPFEPKPVRHSTRGAQNHRKSIVFASHVASESHASPTRQFLRLGSGKGSMRDANGNGSPSHNPKGSNRNLLGSKGSSRDLLHLRKDEADQAGGGGGVVSGSGHKIGGSGHGQKMLSAMKWGSEKLLAIGDAVGGRHIARNPSDNEFKS